MSNKYQYGKKTFDVTPSDGVEGILIKGLSGFYFRVTDDNGRFIDYEIAHDDLSITIDKNSLASFYTDGESYFIDHNPSVLGLITTKGAVPDN